MTDERQGEALWSALDRLPRGSAVIFRHYHLPPSERLMLFDRVRRACRKNGLTLLIAGAMPEPTRADGYHGRRPRYRFAQSALYSAPAHDRREIRAAERARADIILLSPVFATRSHPNGDVLGLMRFAALRRSTRLPVIALGGMNQKRGYQLKSLGADGWAGIDSWGQ